MASFGRGSGSACNVTSRAVSDVLYAVAKLLLAELALSAGVDVAVVNVALL
eukprot:CAMPEP_0172676740 /NCGR_PEP_ID=MMETSP1074-20121228/14194_1 /TAXON_ID=2916 /ORGANISM="Ceratium fusus, Strain PA161109" /LENGTH=50 /DNA_ID=CAMNT_0013494461 /DNA_START=129 /DNA_END=281 /DNA_ORIENTATION=+